MLRQGLNELINIVSYNPNSQVLSAAHRAGAALGVHRASAQLLRASESAGAQVAAAFPEVRRPAEVLAGGIEFVAGSRDPRAVGAALGGGGAIKTSGGIAGRAIGRTGMSVFSRGIDLLGGLARKGSGLDPLARVAEGAAGLTKRTASGAFNIAKRTASGASNVGRRIIRAPTPARVPRVGGSTAAQRRAAQRAAQQRAARGAAPRASDSARAAIKQYRDDIARLADELEARAATRMKTAHQRLKTVDLTGVRDTVGSGVKDILKWTGLGAAGAATYVAASSLLSTPQERFENEHPGGLNDLIAESDGGVAGDEGTWYTGGGDGDWMAYDPAEDITTDVGWADAMLADGGMLAYENGEPVGVFDAAGNLHAFSDEEKATVERALSGQHYLYWIVGAAALGLAGLAFKHRKQIRAALGGIGRVYGRAVGSTVFRRRRKGWLHA